MMRNASEEILKELVINKEEELTTADDSLDTI